MRHVLFSLCFVGVAAILFGCEPAEKAAFVQSNSRRSVGKPILNEKHDLIEAQVSNEKQTLKKEPVLADMVPFLGMDQYDTFKSDPYIQAAARLQAMGRKQAESIMAKAANNCDVGDSSFILCRMLYKQGKNGEFRRPGLGAPGLIGVGEMRELPLEPIAIVDGVPFLLVRGYLGAGARENPSNYLSYCINNHEWSNFQFKTKSKAEKLAALYKLLHEANWATPPTNRAKQFLEEQIK